MTEQTQVRSPRDWRRTQMVAAQVGADHTLVADISLLLRLSR